MDETRRRDFERCRSPLGFGNHFDDFLGFLFRAAGVLFDAFDGVGAGGKREKRNGEQEDTHVDHASKVFGVFTEVTSAHLPL